MNRILYNIIRYVGCLWLLALIVGIWEICVETGFMRYLFLVLTLALIVSIIFAIIYSDNEES